VNDVFDDDKKIVSVVMDPGIGIQRSGSLALFCERKKIRIFKVRIRIFVAYLAPKIALNFTNLGNFWHNFFLR
jgi:hypothetical protein